jgi:DNA-binding PadR family transcriptional regulator
MRDAYMTPTDRDRRRVDDFLPLRVIEFQILLSLAVGERHGYGIIRDAEARGDGKAPDVGTLYRALARMAEQGLITTANPHASDPEAERRIYYRITALGLKVAKAEAVRLAALTRAAQLGGLLPEGMP